MSNRPSLAQKFAVLIAERERTWTAERLEKNRAERRDLAACFDPRRTAQPGDSIGAATLLDTDGKEVHLEDEIRHGPLVLVFFRFGGCPACGVALPHYEQHLRPVLEKEGVRVLAITPQVPELLKAYQEETGIRLRLLSDPNNDLARRLGITFQPAEIPEGPPTAGWIGELTGTGNWELPQPTVLLLRPDLRIGAIKVSPDWLDRPEVDEIVDLARQSLGQHAG